MKKTILFLLTASFCLLLPCTLFADAPTPLIEEWLDGGSIYRRLEWEGGEGGAYHAYTYQDGHLILENDPIWGVKVYDYDVSWNLLGYTRIYLIDDEFGPGTRIREEYNSSYQLTTKYEWGDPFYSGVNLPWVDYGWDIGIRPDGIHGGFSTAAKRDVLDQRFRELAGSVSRVFLFCDLRSGIEIDGVTGDIIGFDAESVADLKQLLNAAEANGVSLILTLFDYTLADGVAGGWNGEYPQFITDSAKRAQLIDAVHDLFIAAGLDNYESVIGFDIMNEPEVANQLSGIPYTDLQDFVSDFGDMLHTDFPDYFVTVGAHDRDAMIANWVGLVDAYQFHDYDGMGQDLNVPVDSLGLPPDSLVLTGEIEPTDFISKLQTLYDNGYLAGLFWQDDGSYIITAGELDLIMNWFYGTTYEYYLDSGFMWKKTGPDGIIYEYTNEDYLGDGYGKLIKQTYTDGSYKTFSDYHPGTRQYGTLKEYDADDNLIATYYYEPFLLGDFNLDGMTNATDLAILKAYFGGIGDDLPYFHGNANGDDVINATDLAILKANFGQYQIHDDEITILFDENTGDTIVEFHPDGHREIYVYQGGLFTKDDIFDLASIYLQEGDIIIEVLPDGTEQRYDYEGNILVGGGDPDIMQVMAINETKDILKAEVPPGVQVAGYVRTKRKNDALYPYMVNLRWK